MPVLHLLAQVAGVILFNLPGLKLNVKLHDFSGEQSA